MTKKKISIIIIAMQEELDYLLKAISGQYKTVKVFDEEAFEYSKNGVDYLILRGKIGKVSTAFYLGKLSVSFDIERIFNIGTSGGVSEELKVGDVVVANEVAYHDIDVTGFGYKLGQVPGFPESYKCDEKFVNKPLPAFDDFKVVYGRVTSSDSFITRKNKDKFFIKEAAPKCVEMESGSVGQCAYLMNVPFVVIRSISDIITAEEHSAEATMNMELSCSHCVQVLLSILD